ncbi:helix-turn-helix domain-containing protein [Apilactobacillus timberlakei]|uniref:helix-turn-helix domain-containing protein n=1 Tax=Apilactobacillus timberlakei TaxID=2008380 RepID=UPI0015E86195|nr:helix-turn-helix transcriptional regulator [Apilactobacillus timberlakei]
MKISNNDRFYWKIKKIIEDSGLSKEDRAFLFDPKYPHNNFFWNHLLLPVLLKRNITIREVSNKSGVSSSALFELISGETDCLKISNVIKIAKSLDIDPARWLLAIGEFKDNGNVY